MSGNYLIIISDNFVDVSQSRSGSYSFSRQRSYCGYEGSAAKYSQGYTD